MTTTLEDIPILLTLLEMFPVVDYACEFVHVV
jgi:hypothetical protein